MEEGTMLINMSIGFYPGILLGMRTYQEENSTLFAIYLPFIDFVIEKTRV